MRQDRPAGRGRATGGQDAGTLFLPSLDTPHPAGPEDVLAAPQTLSYPAVVTWP
ncbi:MAG: hypothetical protein NTY19_38560 [Planctomycetota bacterium]|nr:hypothetical protein [Planctomycetota bacterium]